MYFQSAAEDAGSNPHLATSLAGLEGTPFYELFILYEWSRVIQGFNSTLLGQSGPMWTQIVEHNIARMFLTCMTSPRTLPRRCAGHGRIPPSPEFQAAADHCRAQHAGIAPHLLGQCE